MSIVEELLKQMGKAMQGGPGPECVWAYLYADPERRRKQLETYAEHGWIEDEQVEVFMDPKYDAITWGNRCYVGQPMSRCYIIAEVGLSHMGDPERAAKSIVAFKQAGADAIKFQDHRGQVVPEGQPHPSSHVKMTRREWYERTSFDQGHWRDLRALCDQWAVDYICSPFSVEALREQVKLKPRYIKIASGEVTNAALLNAAGNSGLDVLVSLGMATDDEIDQMHATTMNREPIWMSCVSEYPCAPEHADIDGTAISDHTTGIWFPIAAVARGATMIEKHVHLEDCAHSDRDIALLPEKFAEMVEGIRSVETALYEPSEPDLTDLTEIRRVYLHGG